MTTQELANSYSAQADIPDTEVIAIAMPAPVFVDHTGRRSRLLRRIAYAFGLLVMVYGGLICLSLAGGPVNSSAVLPVPGLDAKADDRSLLRPGPSAQPDPRQSKSFDGTDRPTRRGSGFHEPGERAESTRAPLRPGRPAWVTSPKASGSPTRPLESAAATPSTATPTAAPTDGSTTTPKPTPGTGGQAGGESVPTSLAASPQVTA